MNIVVCLKQVPDATEVRIDPKTNTLMREGVPAIINPYDLHALEEAIQYKERYQGKVTVITMGPSMAEVSLKKAIAYGADQAILITDRAFAGSDTLATSYILAGAIKKLRQAEPVDLIFCGKQAIDGDTAQVGPGIAARLGIAQLTFVMKVDAIDKDNQMIQVQRKLENRREVVRARMPALLTVEKSINQIRYASLPNLIKGARYQIIIWTKDDLNLDEKKLGLKGSPTKVSRIFAPPQRQGGEIIGGAQENPERAAKELVDKLIARDIPANC